MMRADGTSTNVGGQSNGNTLNRMKEANLVLVHGTFAQGAAWTDPKRSSLCKQIVENLGDRPVVFHQLKWSGKNHHDDRKSAGQALANQLREFTQPPHGGPCFVIGHSHGGAVIAHAVKDDPLLANKLDGVVFLSTPFIHLKRRHFSKFLAPPLGVILFVLLFVGIGWFAEWAMRSIGAADWVARAVLVIAMVEAILVFGYLTELPSEDLSRTPYSRSIPLAPFVVFPPALIGSGFAEYAMNAGWIETWATVAGILFAVVVFVVGVAIYAHLFPNSKPDKSTNKNRQTTSRINAAMDWLIEDFAVRNLRPETTLFVRSTGDEATAALGWVQAISRLIGEVISRVIRVFKQHGPKMVLLSVFAFIAMYIAAYFFAAVSTDAAVFSGTSWTDLWRNFVKLHEFQGVLFGNFVNLFWNLVWILIFGICIFLALCAVILTMFNRAFGRWFLWTALFLEVTVESVPPGKWELLQLDAKDESESWDGVQPDVLAHSLSYADERAIAAVAKWIATRISFSSR